MAFIFFRRFFLLPVFLFANAYALLPEQAREIGKRLYANECSSKEEKLVWWNVGEEFASLGIGHFIWYPVGQAGIYEETFPALLAFFKTESVALPEWLETSRGCPWESHAVFYSGFGEEKKKQLRELLSSTVELQTRFIAERFEKILPRLLLSCPEEKKTQIKRHIDRLCATPHGNYCLLDYLNFKGEGTSVKERYRGQGWGLLQVLEEMPAAPADICSAFSKTAESILKRRIQNSPPERGEERWLPGWLKRTQSYMPNGNLLE